MSCMHGMLQFNFNDINFCGSLTLYFWLILENESCMQGTMDS